MTLIGAVEASARAHRVVCEHRKLERKLGACGQRSIDRIPREAVETPYVHAQPREHWRSERARDLVVKLPRERQATEAAENDVGHRFGRNTRLRAAS